MAVVVLLLCGLLTTAFSKDPNPAECRRSTLGFDYVGHRNRTVSGIPCQAWKDQEPHNHTHTDPRMFPDDTLDDASNFCRNPPPSPKLDGPWCYTMDPGIRWERCDIPACSEFPECRRTDAGIEYQGFIKKARSGADCVAWDSVPASAATASVRATDENYCRNPDAKPEGPWCYTDVSGTWEFCDVPFCKPSAYCSRTPVGREFVGRVSRTGNGVPCQRWDSQYPHEHGFVNPGDFPDATISDASNYCRNPDGRSTGPWCYTKDPDVVEESCEIPVCQDCKISDNGVEYAGVRSVTRSSRACLAWADLQFTESAPLKDADRFPDASLADASNYCRNPDRKDAGPWCYWGQDSVSWDYCDVPKCSGTGKAETFKPRRASHVVHIGIDGLHPCFVNSSTGASNIMGRLAALGTYTLSRGRTVINTVSAPSWTAILCGLPIETSGVTGNSWEAPWLGFRQPITPTMGPNVPFPCVYYELKSQDSSIRTASFTNWNWFYHLTSMGIPTGLDYDFYCDDYSTCDPELVATAASYLNRTLGTGSGTTEASYTFVYIGNVDGTGHSMGWCGPEYMDAVDIADRLVGELLDAVDQTGSADRTLVMLSSDHGGHLRGHGMARDSDLIVPAFVRGPGIRKGAEFRHELRNADYTPTAAEMLGLRASPWWKGDVMWEAFEEPATD